MCVLGAIHLLTMYEHCLSTILDRSPVMEKLKGSCMVASERGVRGLNALYGVDVGQSYYPNFLGDNVTKHL